MTSNVYIGKGTIYARRTSGTPELYHTSLGNCSKLSLNISEDKKELMDYENAGGGMSDRISRIKSVSLNITSHKITADNLARFMRGILPTSADGNLSKTQTLTASTTIYAGQLITLNFVPDTAKAITVTINDVVKDADTDYTVTRSGILAKVNLSTSTGTSTIAYKTLANTEIEPITASNEYYEVVFDGLNESNGNAPVLVKCYRVQFSPLKSLSLIGDDFADIAIEGELLLDDTKVATGVSKYFQIKMV